jgi:hypothetical protein
MSDKVRGGTPKGSNSICLNCRKAQVIRGINFQSQIICYASSKGFVMGYPVEECSVFDDKRVPALYQMEQIAWTVQSRNRGPIGFAGDGRMEVTIVPPDADRNSPVPQQSPVAKAGEPEGSEI